MSFHYSGTLRPGKVSAQQKVPPHICRPDYADRLDGRPEGELIKKRSGVVTQNRTDEIKKIRESCKVCREIFDIASQEIKVGATPDHIDQVVFNECMKRNVYPSTLNYCRFPKSLCISVNEVICHGIPDDRPFQDGDLINLDLSIYKDGFHADMNESFMLGKVDQQTRDLVRIAYESMKAAADQIKPGFMYRDLGKYIELEANRQNCSVVRSYCGHGVGKHFHEPPTICHYAKNKTPGFMRPGHIFTIEPMINNGPNHRDMLWPDQWTVSTVDGQRSAQFEHTFLCTANGYEVLTGRQGVDQFSVPDYNESWFMR